MPALAGPKSSVSLQNPQSLGKALYRIATKLVHLGGLRYIPAMVPHSGLAPPSAASPSASATERLAERLVAGCPALALLVGNNGQVRRASEEAARLFGRRGGLVPGGSVDGSPVRELLGLGWLELALAAREGHSDLVVDLPIPAGWAAGAVATRGWRLRPEPVEGENGQMAALVIFLEPPAEKAPQRPRPSRQPEGFAAIFGHDPVLRATKDAAERFARTRLPVLLLAETGTGKELLARAIHAASPRQGRAFVAINCGALSPHLLESELFGYAPGAFTGASREGSEGKIGAARGGTLFLDEVAEMPGPLQALLLRVLEDGTYYRVGDTVPRHADIRLITATCRDLPRMVVEGAFRQDLFYRIDGACLTLPPLRERSDLPELTLHLLSCLAEEEPGIAPPRLSPEAFDWLISQPWPGNVRQLKTALQHALVLAGGGELRREHLPVLIGGLPRSAGSPRPEMLATPTPRAYPPLDLEISAGASPPLSPEIPVGAGRRARPPLPSAEMPPSRLEDLEAEIVRQAVEQANGNLSLAARRLGIARTTLYRRLRRDET